MGVRVEVHIERLVAEGMGRSGGHRVAASLERELCRLLTDRGAPQGWRVSGLQADQIQLESVDIASPEEVGKRLAAATYGAVREPNAIPETGCVAPKLSSKEGNLS